MQGYIWTIRPIPMQCHHAETSLAIAIRYLPHLEQQQPLEGGKERKCVLLGKCSYKRIRQGEGEG